MELLDSRRLTGANFLWDHPGAVLEVKLAEGEEPAAIESAWRTQITAILSALDLPVELVQRRYPGGVSLAFAAASDMLYTATEINEWAFTAAQGAAAPDLESAVTRFREELAKERDERLTALEREAARRGINFCGDDEWTTIGMGARGQTWETSHLPRVDEVDWEALADIPSVLVTGTNGKTTTIRLLVAIAQAAKLIPGASSTDWIQVGETLLDKDDWSGPGGARAVLKDSRVQVALLETARGGLLRRGLAVPRTDVAVVLNVAEDHLGEMGVHTLDDLTEVKFIVRRAGDQLVLNADDAQVRKRGMALDRPIVWVSLDGQDELLQAQRQSGAPVAYLEAGQFILEEKGERRVLMEAAQAPITLGGCARYNMSNVLCAAAAAWRMGLPIEAIRRGLQTFESDPTSNPGRLNVFEFGSLRAMVDFAHNPHGMRALFEMMQSLPHERSAVLIGQAGDRDDQSIAQLARITAQAKPDLIIIKQMSEHLRGRAAGVVVSMLDQTLREHGTPADHIQHAPSELEAVRLALGWARPGDLLLLLSHAERDAVLDLMARLRDTGWLPGQPLP